MGCGKRVAGHRQRKSCCSGQAGAALSLLLAAQSLGCSSVRVSARLLSPCSKQELPLAVPETPGGLCGAPGEEHPPGPVLGTAAAWLRCGPTTQELAGTTREGPHVFTTSIPLLCPCCPGPWCGTATPASVTGSPNPGSELGGVFLLFGFSSAHKNLDPGPLSAKRTECLGLPR